MPTSITNCRPTWSQIAPRFTNEQDCLAAFIALEAAEVIAGVKPSALISIPNRPLSCGRNLFTLWHKYAVTILGHTDVSAYHLKDQADAILVLFYRTEPFKTYLQRRDISTLLGKAGYSGPFTPDHAISQLAARFTSAEFPHEIGLFLGYPIKDVMAFMGWITLPFACQGPWKMYGNPQQSLSLAERFHECRRHMARLLGSSANVNDCFATVLHTPLSNTGCNSVFP